MRALAISSYGGPEVMKVQDVPDPVAGPGDVVVRVKAVSVNPVDWKVRSGMMRVITGSRFPRVLGGDFSGVVESVGRGVTGLQVGDQVYGSAPVFSRRNGSHAQRVAVPADKARKMPLGLEFTTAASLPIAALTVLAGLRPGGNLTGKQVLVNGATGGVGHFAVQVAKARGATVTAVCSGRNAELARTLGADRVVDYTKEDVTAGGKQFDIVLDAHAGMGVTAAARVLKSGGYYASTMPSPVLVLRGLVGRLTGGPRVVLANMRDKPEDYAELEALLARGAVKPVIEQTFPLEQATAAYAAQEGGKGRGKVVILVD